MARAPVVWAPQPSWSKQELANIADYGTLKTILHRSSVPGQTIESSFRNIMNSLREYRIGDYITAFPADPAGPFLMGLAMGVRGEWEEPMTWLRYERPLGPDGERMRGEIGTYEVTRFQLRR